MQRGGDKKGNGKSKEQKIFVPKKVDLRKPKNKVGYTGSLLSVNKIFGPEGELKMSEEEILD